MPLGDSDTSTYSHDDPHHPANRSPNSKCHKFTRNRFTDYYDNDGPNGCAYGRCY